MEKSNSLTLFDQSHTLMSNLDTCVDKILLLLLIGEIEKTESRAAMTSSIVVKADRYLCFLIQYFGKQILQKKGHN